MKKGSLLMVVHKDNSILQIKKNFRLNLPVMFCKVTQKFLPFLDYLFQLDPDSLQLKIT